MSSLMVLQHLGLGECSSVTDSGVARLRGLTVLQHLLLSACGNVKDSGLAYLSGLTA